MSASVPPGGASFGARVRQELVPFLERYLGADAGSLVDAEIAESGEPTNLIAALALGHALLVRIADEAKRSEAHEGLDALLRNIKAASLVPPPVSS